MWRVVPADHVVAGVVPGQIGLGESDLLDPFRLFREGGQGVPSLRRVGVVPGKHLLRRVDDDLGLLGPLGQAHEAGEDPPGQLLGKELAELPTAQTGHLVDEVACRLGDPLLHDADPFGGEGLRHDGAKLVVLGVVHGQEGVGGHLDHLGKVLHQDPRPGGKEPGVADTALMSS